MNRRDALKTLAAVPLAGAMLPDAETLIPLACDCDCCPMPSSISVTLSDGLGNIIAQWTEKSCEAPSAEPCG